MNDVVKSTELPIGHNRPHGKAPTRQGTADSAATAVAPDIEHAPVQDDPRSWSSIRKVGPGQQLSYTKHLHGDILIGLPEFYSILNFWSFDGCRVCWYYPKS